MSDYTRVSAHLAVITRPRKNPPGRATAVKMIGRLEAAFAYTEYENLPGLRAFTHTADMLHDRAYIHGLGRSEWGALVCAAVDLEAELAAYVSTYGCCEAGCHTCGRCECEVSLRAGECGDCAAEREAEEARANEPERPYPGAAASIEARNAGLR